MMKGWWRQYSPVSNGWWWSHTSGLYKGWALRGWEWLPNPGSDVVISRDITHHQAGLLSTTNSGRGTLWQCTRSRRLWFHGVIVHRQGVDCVGKSFTTGKTSVCGSNTADTVRTDFKALDCFISLFYLGFFCNFPYVLPVSEDLLEEIWSVM